MPRTKIVATTDGSGVSEAVLPHAASLAAALDADLMVVRVLSPALDAGDVFAPDLAAAVRITSERWQADLSAQLAALNVQAEPLIEVRRHRDEIHDTVLRVIAEQGANVAALSSRGSNAVRHALLGSVALNVLGRTTVPLLLAGQHIKPPAAGAAAYHILLTTDGSEDALQAVDSVVQLSQHEAVEVSLLKVHIPQAGDRGEAAEVAAAGEHLEELRSRFPDPGRVRTVVRTIVPLGGVDTAILDVATELGASAIAMASHGHSRRYHVFMGSVALGVLGQSSLPVLLVRSAPAKQA